MLWQYHCYMSFLSIEDVQKRVKPSVFTSKFSLSIVTNFFGWRKVNKFYETTENLNVKQFLTAYKKQSGIKHILSEKHFNNIPTEGSLLVVANHPTGIPDGLLILDTLLKVRSDVKIVANDLTYKVEPIKDYTIPVDPYDNSDSRLKNASQLKSILNWLNEGHCVVLFPAGDVSDFDFKTKKITENFWHPTAKKIILKHKGQVLPWAISGKNSPLFYRLGQIHPSIKSALIPREGLKKRRKPIYSIIGKSFRINGNEQLLMDLETKIRLMSWSISPKKRFQIPFNNLNLTVQQQTKIAAPIETSIVEREIISLGNPIIEKGNYQVFVTQWSQSPNLMFELGRLRETTFRAVNEGTGNDRDLDRYDKDFDHIILWDTDTKSVAGAYRMGVGAKLFLNPDYHHILHDFYHKTSENTEILKQSAILGRAFVTEAHQQKPFPLFLLWQGIKMHIKTFPEAKYIIGQTSLPNSFHPYSKNLIVSYLCKHHSHPTYFGLFNAFNPFESNSNFLIDRWIANSTSEDFKRLDKLVECIEPDGNKIPMLFKRYIEQNATCVGINIDPDFNNSIDILMLTDISTI